MLHACLCVACSHSYYTRQTLLIRWYDRRMSIYTLCSKKSARSSDSGEAKRYMRRRLNRNVAVGLEYATESVMDQRVWCCVCIAHTDLCFIQPNCVAVARGSGIFVPEVYGPGNGVVRCGRHGVRITGGRTGMASALSVGQREGA